MCITSADAANCYDRINHAIIALMYLTLGVPVGSIIAMLLTIQLMKFFLRTNTLLIMMGLCQGNGAAPASWLVLSSVLVRILRQLGYGTRIRSPISRVLLDIMGVLYVADTDLMIMDECIRYPYDLWKESQEACMAWGKLLIATGGTLKPEKCFYYLLDYEWQEDGSWQMIDMVDLPSLTVPFPNGTDAKIEQLPVTEAKKTLGVWTNPAGICSKQLAVIREATE